MSEKGLEVLSPAGNLEIFKAVINAGADAVYFGGEKFGARAFAKNFTIKEAEAAIRYAHIHGSKAYLTINTLLKNKEIERELYDYVNEYYEAGLDAVIVQDFAVFDFVRHYFPDLMIHASTQMTVTNSYGAKYLQELGASRIVTAREISLKEISNMYDACGVEIETFVHGALCVSYSGQCLMSSMIGGRSGNRGRCAQPCRLPYEVLDTKHNLIQSEGAYVLSPKDLCTIEYLPQLSESGVYSLKIEGRMKQLEYAAGVVSLYRKYADLYLEKGKDAYRVTKEDSKKLFDLGNRCGFTHKYLFEQNGPDMMTFKEPSHKKQSTFTPDYNEKKILLNASLTAKLHEPLVFEVWDDNKHRIKIEKEPVESAMKAPASKEQLMEKLNKTGNTSFEFRNIEVVLDDNVFVPVGKLNEIRREAIESLEQTIIAHYKENPIAYDKYFHTISKEALHSGTNTIQRHQKVIVTVESLEQLKTCVKAPFVDEIGFTLELCAKHRDEVYQIINDHITTKNFFGIMPIIFRLKSEMKTAEVLDELIELGISSMMIHSYDALGYLLQRGFKKENIILSNRMYTFSNQSLEAFRAQGFSHFTIPLELNEKDIMHRSNQDSQMVIYGRTDVMVTANCIHKNSEKCNGISTVKYLRDRYQNEFPVTNHCVYCYNVIYNNKPTSLLAEMDSIKKLPLEGVRMDFTLENEKETSWVLKEFEDAFIKGKSISFDADRYTRGHYKRGVE